MKTLFLLLLLITLTVAQQTDSLLFELEGPIVVTAARNQTPLLRSARTVTIIDSVQLNRLPVSSLTDALNYVGGLDLQQRGSQGVQADVNIRGAGFEQVLILIDGLKVNDPQSGHHNLNLPLPLEAISRIEILKGSGSRLYGPSAMGGVINIITNPSKTPKLDVTLTGGDYQFNEVLLNVHHKAANSSHGLYFKHSASKGFRPNTDFTMQTVTYQSAFHLLQIPLTAFSGFTSKQFGANRFYHPAFPNQREKTKVFFLRLGSRFTFSSKQVQLTPRLYWRRHLDDFVLDYTKPNEFHNRHTTDVLGAELRGNFKNRFGTLALHGEWQQQFLSSNNLGKHEQFFAGFSFEQEIHQNRWQLNAGSSFYLYNIWGWQINPGLDLSFQLTPRWTVYASVGSGFRPPSFTERFYQSKANRGNPNLKPEHSSELEVGSRFFKHFAQFSIAAFYRTGHQLIDWIFQQEEQYWQALNIANMQTTGLETGLTLFSATRPTQRLTLHYTYLTANKSAGQARSKYVLNYLQHQLLVGLNHQLPGLGCAANWQMRFEQRVTGQQLLLIDAYLQKALKRYSFFVQATNIFNRKYSDFIGVPQPGRWFKMGIKIQLLSDSN